jgi:hypothetical protein
MSPSDFAPDLAPTSPPGASETTSPRALSPTGEGRGRHLAPRPRPGKRRRGWWVGLACRICGRSVTGKTEGHFAAVVRDGRVVERRAEHGACRFGGTR